MEGQVTLVQAPCLEQAQVAGELCVLEPASGALVVLNETASTVWSLFSRPRTLAQAVEELSTVFSVDHDRLLREVGQVVGDLESRQLLVRAEGGTDAEASPQG